MKTYYLILLLSVPAAAQETYRLAHVTAPPLTRFYIGINELKTKYENSVYYLYLPQHITYPFTLKLEGPLGGFVLYPLEKPDDFNNIHLREDIILDKNSRPQSLTALPQLCPRLYSRHNNFFYNAKDDILNHVPSIQLVDRDALENDQYKTGSEMDGKNVLLLKKVTITYDYEDSKIIDSIGVHPLTGKTQVIHEGEGGFYANIHYAIIPYNKKVFSYDKQLLMHMAQGTLSDINKNEYRPTLRTHSFIPGPFLSKDNSLYSMCEWGDTAYQAPKQELFYNKMALWDWDYSVENADHVLMIVWEGDEEEWLIKKELIDPFFITDDVIGIFELKKEELKNEKIFKNPRGNFEMVLINGDF
ncbi:hypothetical protein K1X76_01235 [bacterium]|nr:hypothetical protein [bacterium]